MMSSEWKVLLSDLASLSILMTLHVSLSFRAKYHKLKYGTELNQGEVKMPSFESGTVDLHYNQSGETILLETIYVYSF